MGIALNLTGRMVMTIEALIVWLVIGAIAGWLAGLIMEGYGFGLIGNIVVGIVGALIAGWLLPQLGFVLIGGIGAAIPIRCVKSVIGAAGSVAAGMLGCSSETKRANSQTFSTRLPDDARRPSVRCRSSRCSGKATTPRRRKATHPTFKRAAKVRANIGNTDPENARSRI